jgi:hypothetical protein
MKPLIILETIFSDIRPADVFGGLCLAVFINIQALAYGVMLVVLLNSISGIWKYAILHDRLYITASGIKRTIQKLGGYGIVLVTFGILDVLIMQVSNQEYYVTISMITAGLIILYEGKSITDNLREITGMGLFSAIYDTVVHTFRKRTELDIESKIQPTVDKVVLPELRYDDSDDDMSKIDYDNE